MATPTREQVIEYIRDAASKRGIDPDVAVAVAMSEGLNSRAGPAGAFASDIVTKSGKKEASYGAFQLYTGGGLGNAFQKATGLNPADPANWAQTIDFALDAAAKGGWSPFHGAARVGIGKWDGLKGSKAAGNWSNAGQMGTRNLQQALTAAGFNPGKIDGVMGPRTREAVKAFQQANGLKVDGIAGPRTMAALSGTSVQTAGNRSFRSAPGINIAPTAFRSGNFLPAPDVARFQRDTASLGKGAVSGGKGSYQYTGNARGQVNPQLVAAVQAASAALGKSITITSAARTNNPKSEHYVGKGGKGHGNAFDLDISSLSDQEKALVAQTLAANGVTRMGTYTNTPSMLHIDMGSYGVREKGKVHFMHDKSIKNIAAAPGWFQGLYSNGLSVGKPTEAQVQVASNVVNQIADGLKSSKNGIAYASLSPKNAPASRSFYDTPRAGMPEQMEEGFSTSNAQLGAAAPEDVRDPATGIPGGIPSGRAREGYVPMRERVNEYLKQATSFNPGMSPPTAREAAATRATPQVSTPTPQVQGMSPNGSMAPAAQQLAAAYTQRGAYVPGSSARPAAPAPAPARQAVPASATQFSNSPPTAAQAELARQVAGARALSGVPVSRQPAMPSQFDAKVASPVGVFDPNKNERVVSRQVQAKSFTPPAIPGVTGPPLGALNSAPGHVTPSSVADQYGIGPGGYGAGFDSQAATPAPQRQAYGWDARIGRERQLTPSEVAAWEALGPETGRMNPLGMFSGLSSMLGGQQQEASSSFNPMSGIMGIFNGGGATAARPGQEYGQPGYDAMMSDPTVKASTDAILGRPLDGSVRHSTLDPATGLPVAQDEPQMPAFHMGRIFGAPGAPAAGLGGLLGAGLSMALPGVGNILGGLLGGRGLNVGGLFGGIANQAIGALGRGIASGGGNAPGSGLAGAPANMGVNVSRDSSGRVSYDWGPQAGERTAGAVGAGWANNNPERSYGGYGSGYDPTPV